MMKVIRRAPATGMRPRAAEQAGDQRMERDLTLLARFIQAFCEARHTGAERGAVVLPDYHIPMLRGRPPELCADCRKLLAHALVKRSHCPMNPKPACKKCPKHCYAPKYRAQIREVMRFSGQRMVLRGRLDYLLHLFLYQPVVEVRFSMAFESSRSG